MAYLVDRLFEWGAGHGQALSVNMAVVRDRYNPTPITKPLTGGDYIDDWSACGQAMMDLNNGRLRGGFQVIFSDRVDHRKHSTGEYETWRIELDRDGFMYRTITSVDGDPSRSDQSTITSVTPVVDLNTERGTDDEYLMAKFEIGKGSMLIVLSIDSFKVAGT